MEDSFLDTFLGHPAEGSFLAWLSDGGLWALLIALGAIIGWWAVRLVLRRGLRQAIRGLDQHEATADVGMAVQAADSWISTFFTAIVFGVAAVLGILQVLGSNIDPALDYLKDFGSASFNWLVTDGLRIVLILFLSWVVARVARRAIPRLLSSIMLTQASTADHDEIMKRSETLSSVFVGGFMVIFRIFPWNGIFGGKWQFF